MKNRFLLLIPLVLGLASCGGSKIPNQDTVNKVKEILNKQDLSEFYTKSLRAMYSQEYNVLDIYNDYSDIENYQDEKATSYFNYLGSGFLGMYHDLTVDEYNSIVDENGNIDTFDAIAQGKGYYGTLNTMRTMSFNRQGSAEAKIYNLDISQSTTVKSSDQDVWVDNTLYVSDSGIFHYEDRQNLNASISKQLLFGSVSTRTFREIFYKTNLFDVPGNVEHLDKLYYSICRDLVSKSDKEISDFVLANQISIQEGDNIEVNFVYSNEDVDEEEMDYIFPGVIKGTLTFDKSTYKFTYFSYEIAYKLESYNEDSGSIKLINLSFTCEGESSHDLPHDSWEPIDPVVYDDVAEFLKDVNEQVVPPNIYL